MSRFMKHLLGIAVFLFISVAAFAQKVEFEVNAPTVVAAGEAFRIEFSLNAKPEEFTPPTFTGFDVLAGPTLSEGTSVSIVNSNVSKTSSFTYTYVIQAPTEGKATIAAATVIVDGKSYQTKPLAVEVISGETPASSGNGSSAAEEGSVGDTPHKKASVAADDLLLRVTANRNTVYKGQPIRVLFKLYTRVPLSGIESAKYPAFNGFWSQDLKVDGYDWQRETLNGKVYNARIIKEVLLYPQQSGQLHIEQSSLTVIAQMVVQSRRSQSVFDDFFGGGQNVQEVRKEISASPLAITVRDFPAGAPVSFNGAVGQFQMQGSVDKSTMSANASGNFLLKLSGSGNLPLIQAPTVEMPTSFEQYNKKTTESLTNNANGITGYRQFEYPFIPRAEGSYTINPVEFSYFDPDAAKYVTLATSAFNIDVDADSTGGATSGIVSGINKEDLKILDKDIRFIHIGEPQLVRRGSLFFASATYFGALLLILLVFIGAYLYLKKYLNEMQNTTLVRNKKANKVALQRLRAAFHYMNEASEKQFYEEMLKALWGYMSDKLNIPVANLTKDNIREELVKRGVATELITHFIDIISNCEYAQYSPSTSGQMSEVYGSAAATLSKFEAVIKK